MRSLNTSFPAWALRAMAVLGSVLLMAGAQATLGAPASASGPAPSRQPVYSTPEEASHALL
jgi:hypothetical protein